MLDPKLIRHELEATATRLLTKCFELDVQLVQSLEDQRKRLQVETEELQATRNMQSKAIGQAKSKGEDIQPLLDAVANLGDQLNSKKQELEVVQSRLNELLMTIPNVPDSRQPSRIASRAELLSNRLRFASIAFTATLNLRKRRAS